MTKSKQTETSTTAELAHVVSQLTEEVKVLRMVIDELREEVQWNNQNARRDPRAHAGRRIQSCSIDPTDPHFEVNSVDLATVERLRSDLIQPRTMAGKQGQLFG